VRQAIKSAGDSRPDWWITSQLAQKMGGKGFSYNKPSEIMTEINATVPIYGGISYQRLENGGLQWPCTADLPDGTAILYQEAFDGDKARFTALEYKPSLEAADANYPLILTGEPSLYNFNNAAMDTGLGAFSVLAGEAQVTVNPGDANDNGINDGETVRIISKRGSTEAKVKVDGTLPAGVVSMPYHLMHDIVSPDTDPISKTPDYTVCAVRLETIPQGEKSV
jgi:formate dehydrogenase alpha subunit